MKKIDTYRDYSCIIVRGFNAVKKIANDDELSKKLIPYITDFCHDKNKIKNEEILELQYIYKRVNNMKKNS